MTALVIGHPLVICRNLDPKNPASRVDDQIEPAIIIPIQFYKVIASAKSSQSNLNGRSIDLTAEFSNPSILNVPMSLCALGKSGRDLFMNDLIQQGKINLLLTQNSDFHATTNVNAYDIGTNFILDAHSCANGASNTSLDVWHHTDLAATSIGLVK